MRRDRVVRPGLGGVGFAVSRGWLIVPVAVGVSLGILFAAFPDWDIRIAALFFNPQAAKFPLSVDYSANVIRRIANWIPYLLLAPAALVLLRKLIFPASSMLMPPSVVLFLVGSFLLGPGLTSNLLLKENWGRPRPNFVQQFAGTAPFQPWWYPSSACTRNCSFVSGEASQAYWTVAPASLAPPQIRPFALGGAVVFGTAVGGLRIAFGRHFVTDVVFAGVITIVIVAVLYRLMLDPLRRNDARMERAITRASAALHRGIGTLLTGVGILLTLSGWALGEVGQYLRGRAGRL
ncbi:phosphatase PAP2 family protein [Methyloceanibacter sp.]|uniref:phosphatase PAP2 family protein n=1 Tax=Methyloceanibacter sp. TaxID=1965321 RepID=UPI002D4E0C9B|nr:phosphatase PAP2 family protein [Methyloceanibacter sp.]HZP09157.1 phosphatase PAP2 family protein [Methyloceanibacter sp.]